MVKFISEEAKNNQAYHSYVFYVNNSQELANYVNNIFIKKGYNLIEGNTYKGIYEEDNRLLRLLFGALVKYFKFIVKY